MAIAGVALKAKVFANAPVPFLPTIIGSDCHFIHANVDNTRISIAMLDAF
ncbi:MAG: hypothetical protein JKX71_07265 [Amylibacter sp.]|nr:hypothetical protein [Amylibacter sp.]